MNLDSPSLSAAQVAKLANLDIRAVHTWTTRGLCDPHRDPAEIRRGRGQARSYSVRDALRFYLMGLLHKQYRTPLPQGKRICEHAFASVNLNNVEYVLVRSSQTGVLSTKTCANSADLIQSLTLEPLATVITVSEIHGKVLTSAKAMLRAQAT